MTSRRQFLRALAATLPAAALYELVHAAPQQPSPPRSIWLPLMGQSQPSQPARPAASQSVWLPLVGQMQPRDPFDWPILGPASGTMRQAFDWLMARTRSYTAVDIARIVRAYARIGTHVGVDWFLAMAQMCHETGSLTSWWSDLPRRNPAGIGVSGATREGTPDTPPGAEWAWDGARWQAGWSFPSWADHAVPTHLGLLLAYALKDEHATDDQLTLMAQTLGGRNLGSLRGIAPTITGLNGRWAVPGTVYGQRIIVLARQMRAASAG
jgi:hypothetical protein